MSSKFIAKIYRILKYTILSRHFYGLSSPFRVLPNFIIIGAKRCGTTSLYNYLAQHPCIVKSSHDHLGFFDDNFDLGLNYYRSFFPSKITSFFIKRKFKNFLTYDVTSTYILNETTAKRIFNTLPGVKIIAILRDPVLRAYSEYNETLKTNNKTEDFSILLNRLRNTSMSESSQDRPHHESFITPNILNKGFYYEQLESYFKLFDHKNILILSTEDLSENPQKTFDQIFEFLNVERFEIDSSKKFSANKYTSLDDNSKNKLNELFHEQNQKLFALIGKKFKW